MRNSIKKVSLFQFLRIDPDVWHSPPDRTCGDSSLNDPACWNRLAPKTVEARSPEAFGFKTQVPICPMVLKASSRILIAAFQSLSNTNPHSQMWVLVDRDFLIRVPQLEHCWEVYAGLTATVIRPYLRPKCSNHFLNWNQPASLIDLARQWFLTKFLILKSS